MACRDCALWDVKRAMDKSGRIRADRGARCMWKSTEVYPASVSPFSSRPATHFMTAKDGEGCPLWKKREDV